MVDVTGRRARTPSCRPLLLAVVVALVAVLAASGPVRADSAASVGEQVVSFRGVQVSVPAFWKVVDLRRAPDTCVRYDVAAVFLGRTGDQSSCPAHVIGGAPVLQIEPLDARAVEGAAATPIDVASGQQLRAEPLPDQGPVTFEVRDARVVMTAVYPPDRAAAIRSVIGSSEVRTLAHSSGPASALQQETMPNGKLNVPGTYHGRGFDACSAPTQSAMDAWRSGTDYRSIGVYLGGVSMGCAQPNLTATWARRQAATGWHIVPTYVGLQAPCTSFHSRMSYVATVAFAQGSNEAEDAAARAERIGLDAPSTLYNDMEAYNSSLPRCVTAVLSYLSGWTHALHELGYQSGVYSSASSGIHDLSRHYTSPDYRRPDDIWIAWWNGKADVDGGPYVPDSQWSAHRRVHQYVGNARESHGGYSLLIDRNYVDVSWVVPPPPGCPTNLDFTGYPMVHPGLTGDLVRAGQCLLARAGFDPGIATGYFGWRMAAAVRAFKGSRGLDPSDPSLRRWAWEALAAAGPTQFLQYGVTGLRVMKVQRALTARLQRTVPITGFFGPVTRRAVMDYQQIVGLDVTGTVGVPTWRALQTGA